MDEVFLLVVHLDEDGVGSPVGRDELKQKVPLPVIALYVLVGTFSFGSGFFEFVGLDPDLTMIAGTLHLRYS